MVNYFEVFGIKIYYYAVMIVSGMIAGSIVAAILCKRRGIKPDIVLNLMIAVIPLCIIGARLYYVLFKLEDFHSFKDVINIRSGGLAIYGGIIGGAVAVFIVTKICKVKFWAIADVVGPSLILGQAIGRWGNYFNQEAHGGEVLNPDYFGLPWSVEINGKYYQATFFYEFVWCMIGFVILFLLAWFIRKKPNGLIFCGYLIIYGIGRTIIEGLRTDSLYLWNTSIRVSQLLSILMIIGGAVFAAVLIIMDIKKKKKGGGEKNGKEGTDEKVS